MPVSVHFIYCLSRGWKILGAKSGFLKLLFSQDELRILGVHIIGHIATELIHYGVMLVEEKKTLHDVIGQVFNLLGTDNIGGIGSSWVTNALSSEFGRIQTAQPRQQAEVAARIAW